MILMGKHLLSSPIIEISSKDSVTKETVMLVHKIEIANANGLDFKEDYTKEYMNTLINKPVVCKYYEDLDDLGTHEQVLDDEGNIIGLNTIAIGTIKEVWIGDIENDYGKALYAKADLWNYKYPEIVSCVEKLFEDGNADSSVEVEIYEYGENPTQEYRYPTSYTYIGNALLGSTVTPADNNAGVISIAQKEIAQAIKNDLANIENNKKGELGLSNKKELFNKGHKIKFHVEVNELSHDDIRQQIYNTINPVDTETDERSYKYWIREVFQTYFIVEEWDNNNNLYKVDYSLNNDNVIVSSEWNKVEITYQVVGTDIQGELNKLQVELNSKKEELVTMSATNEEKVTELQSKITELETKITELNATIVEQAEVKTSLESTVTELNSTVEELTKYKEQVETAEKESQQKELNEKYSNLLSEETFKSEDVQSAIKELNTQKLNEIVVNEVSKSKTGIEVNSKNTKDIVVNAKIGEALIKTNILQRYNIK